MDSLQEWVYFPMSCHLKATVHQTSCIRSQGVILVHRILGTRIYHFFGVSPNFCQFSQLQALGQHPGCLKTPWMCEPRAAGS